MPSANDINNNGGISQMRFAVLFSRRPAAQKWQGESRELLGVVAHKAEEKSAGDFEILRRDGDFEIIAWRGFSLSLHSDLAESYWANLSGDRAVLFVVCREDDDGFRPILLTASGDEAAGHGEVDDLIFSAAMPPPIYQAVEQFVIRHYHPEKKRKRRYAENQR